MEANIIGHKRHFFWYGGVLLPKMSSHLEGRFTRPVNKRLSSPHSHSHCLSPSESLAPSLLRSFVPSLQFHHSPCLDDLSPNSSKHSIHKAPRNTTIAHHNPQSKHTTCKPNNAPPTHPNNLTHPHPRRCRNGRHRNRAPRAIPKQHRHPLTVSNNDLRR